MKKLFTFILIFIGLIAQAQEITTASSAESCIAYIDQLAKTSVSDNSMDLTTEFDGTSFTTTRTGRVLTFISELTDIDWATFNVLRTDTKKDGNISVLFMFDSDVTQKRTTIDNNSIIEIGFDTRRSFSFDLSRSQETKIKDLEIAAKRLAEIAKKGDRQLAVKTRKLPKEGNPSYEETVAYIKTYFDKPSMEGNDSYLATFWYNQGYLQVLTYSILYVDVFEDILHIGIRRREKNKILGIDKNEIINHEIDLSKIESIDVKKTGPHTRDPELNGQQFILSMQFNEKNKAHSGKIDLPFDIIQFESSQNGKELQIYKAFEHLRKLCGAPEPLKF